MLVIHYQSLFSFTDIFQRSRESGTISILKATYGQQDATNSLAAELLKECKGIDEEGSQLLALRDDLLLDIQPIMKQYAHVLHNLMSQSYLATSHHCAWLTAFSSALSGALVSGRLAVDKLAPQVNTHLCTGLQCESLCFDACDNIILASGCSC